MRDRLRAREEPEPDAEWLPTLPLALQIDCFGPANIDDLTHRRKVVGVHHRVSGQSRDIDHGLRVAPLGVRVLP